MRYLFLVFLLLFTPTAQAESRAAIHTWEAPYNVGPFQTAALNRSGIQAAIDDAGSGAKADTHSNLVLLPPGLIEIDDALVIPSGVRLHGAGQGSWGDNFGTTLRIKASVSANVIESLSLTAGDWMHWSEIAYLGIDGNRQNGVIGNCIELGPIGEVVSIHDIQMNRCGGFAFKISGIHAGGFTIQNLSANDNRDGNFWIDSGGRQPILLRGLSGDTSPNWGTWPHPFLKITGSMVVKIEHVKAEGRFEPLVFIDADASSGPSGIGMQVILDTVYAQGNAAGNSDPANYPSDIVRINTGKVSLIMQNIAHTAYTRDMVRNVANPDDGIPLDWFDDPVLPPINYNTNPLSRDRL